MTTDLFEKIDAAIHEQKRAAEEVDQFANDLSRIANQVSNWREHSFSGRLKDGTTARPSNGRVGQIDISVRLPSLEEICVAQQKWLAVTENLQVLVDDVPPEKMKWVESTHPELKKSGRVRYRDLD